MGPTRPTVTTSGVVEFEGVPLSEVDRPMARAFAVRHPRAAAVARNVFADAFDDGLVAANPFAALHIEQSKGRKEHDPLREEEFRTLVEIAVDVHGDHYGRMFRAMILTACYVGERLTGTLLLERDDINYAESEITFKNARFDKTRTVLLLPEAHAVLKSLVPLITSPFVFTSKRGKPLTKTNHYALWNPVRAAFWHSLPEERRRQIVDLDSIG
jgi:integrase